MMKRHNKKLIEMVKKEALTSQQVTIAPAESIAKEEKKVHEKVKKEVKDNVEEIKETIKEETDGEAEETLTALNPKE